MPDTNQTKAIRLVEYLRQLASLRSRLVRNISEYGQVLWLSEIPKNQHCFTQAWGPNEDYNSDIWIEVQKYRQPQLPGIPDQCKDWVKNEDLRKKDDFPQLRTEITREFQNPEWQEGTDQPEYVTETMRLDNFPKVQKVWEEQYLEKKWLPWVEEHNRWESVHKVYAALFSIRQEQLRLGEEYELILGLGLLTLKTSTGQFVRRHLIAADAILEFEAGLGKFTVRPHTEGAKLRPELDMLAIEEQPERAEERAKKGLIQAGDNPWEKTCVEDVLKALVHSIDDGGEYTETLEKSGDQAAEQPIVEYAPALILRKRSTKNFTEMLKKIKQQIKDGGDIPGEFADLAEIRSEEDINDAPGEVNNTFDGEVFFPKPSNKEQRRIVDAIQGANGVLVQGPPGTGKSHTIANLICHLLATGQRMLITAKTPRALQALERLVPDELRPLCINLLGSGVEERRSLESSVNGILTKREEWNEDSANSERTELENHLKNSRREKATVNRQLRDIRESEIHTQSIADGTYKGTAAEIARHVNRNRTNYEWFTDSVSWDKTCQVSADYLQSVLPVLRQFTPEKRRELGLARPELPSIEDFTELIRNEASAAQRERNSTYGADERIANLLVENDLQDIEILQKSFSTFQDTWRRCLAMPHSWMSDALRDILGGNSHSWRALLKVTLDVIAQIGELATAAEETEIEFPDTADIKSLHKEAHELKVHMEKGGKLGWGLFRPKPVRERLDVIKTVRINGRSCLTVKHFSDIADALLVRIECEKAWNFWQGKTNRDQGPYTRQLAVLKSLRDALEDVLMLEDRIAQCRKAVQQCHMEEPIWTDEHGVKKIAESSRLALDRKCRQIAAKEIQSIESPISCMAANGNAHPVTDNLLSAIQTRDTERFEQCVYMIRNLEEQCQHLQKLDEDISELRRLLPQFTGSLEQTCDKPYWEKRIQRIEDAWRWAQARHWIEDYIRKGDVSMLAEQAKQLEEKINKIISQLASLRAWSFCFSRIQNTHCDHMEAWKQSMNIDVGKGTGRHASRHLRYAQEHLNKCRDAVPAWVMPLHRVWDTVDSGPGIFDIIIVDEASQCGFEALPLLYLGKKILIVGDDKQISPDAVGVNDDAVNHLMDDWLHDFALQSSFNIKRSLFNHGKLRYRKWRITLREHFRCMPEIIRFSNDLCYADTPLIPLRQYGANRLPPIEHIFIREGYREGSGNRIINRPEAEAVVNRIVKMCGDEKYNNKTMGVIVLQGNAQADLIRDQLLERLGAEKIESRRLVCGNPYSFQGDERDIVFLSLVAATNERIGTLTKLADERRFNVAASRARDMMILFHSVTRDDLSPACLRRRLLEFFENCQPQQIAGIDRDILERRAAQDDGNIVKPPNPFDSWFEVDVALELLRKGFDVIPQYKVAGRRIDLVVQGVQAKLAVECDGDRWHGPDRYEEDMQRQRQLERCGWEFFRVRGSAYYADKNAALDKLWPMLEERGILPSKIEKT